MSDGRLDELVAEADAAGLPPVLPIIDEDGEPIEYRSIFDDDEG